MAISLKHSFTSPKSDGGDDTLVRPSDWNAEHALTQTTGTLLGRTTAGTGATEEITPGSGLSFTALTLAVDPAGSNTHVQFNDSEALGGSAGFTFDKDSNNLIVANTTTIGTNFIANGSGAYPLNNTSGIALGSTTARFNFTGNTISVTGTITSSGNITGSNVNGAIGYFTGLVNAANFITTGNMNAGSTYVTGGTYPTNNTSGTALGSATQRWVITGNTLSLSSTATITGNVTTSGNINAVVGYFTGAVNATTFTTTGNVNANALYVSGGVYPTSNDAAGLGSSTAQIADLYLADGAIIDWHNSGVQIQEVSNGVQITVKPEGSNSAFTLLGSNNNGGTMVLRNTTASGYSGFNVNDSSDVLACSFQYGNPSAPAFTDAMVFASRKTTTPINFYASGVTAAELRMTIEPSGTGTDVLVGTSSTTVNLLPHTNDNSSIGASGQAFHDLFLVANATAAVVKTSGWVGNTTAFNPTANTILLGNTIGRWVITANTGSFSGLLTSAGNTSTSHVNTSTYFYAGANVYANTTAVRIGNSTVQTIIGNTDIRVGNSTVNVVANSLSIVLANSTVSWNISKPTAAEVSAGDYYLGSDGTWQQPAATTDAAGSDTHVQFNDGGTLFGGTAGFTFTKTTNNVTIGNTITVGTNFIANGSGAYPLSNSAGTALGSSTQRWVLTANTGDFSGVITSTANVTTSGNVNGAFFYASSGVLPQSNTAGTSLGSSTNRWVITANSGTFSQNVVASSFNVFALGCYPTSNTQGHYLGDTTKRWVITANTITTSGDCTLGANVSITANLDVGNVVTAVTKSFLIDHPTKEGMKLRYGSLEGPENGIYVRGRSNCDIVELPEYWVALANAETVTVSLTPIGNTPFLSVYEVRDNKVYVKSASLPIDFYYLVQAERIDVPKLVVEE